MGEQANRDTSRGLTTRRPATAKEYVHDHLRRQILSGVLPGGTRLVQSEVATELEVSTTPVREALYDLAAEGLVRVDPHRGAVVEALTHDELLELFELRRVLEPMVVRLAMPHLTASDVDRLRDLCSAMESTEDIPEWVELNRIFHGVFMDLSGWTRLASIVRSLHDSASPFVAMAMGFRPAMMADGNSDHRVLVEAAEEQDVDRAVQCAIDHMNITLNALEDRLAG